MKTFIFFILWLLSTVMLASWLSNPSIELIPIGFWITIVIANTFLMKIHSDKEGKKVSNFNKNITIELNEFDSHIKLTINDNGVGFKNLNSNIKEILNPYFTTKKEGTGLGLSIVNKIINDHNGSIEFIAKNDGATIKIVFIK